MFSVVHWLTEIDDHRPERSVVGMGEKNDNIEQ